MTRDWARSVGVLVCAWWMGAAARAQPVSDGVARALLGAGPRPRLVVVVSIDQFRADYLTRLADLFLPAKDGGKLGGFRYLMERGAWFVNAKYEHFPLFTGPGHAVIMTGGHPYKTGIVGNEWWDVAQQRVEYCVDDPRWKVVGGTAESKARAMGPANLRSSTVGDELKLATAGRGKVVTLAIKDRASILLGGHAQDVSLWFDTAGGRWISSTAFCRDGKLPAWVERINDDHLPDAMLGKSWEPVLGPAVLAGRSFEPRKHGTDIPTGFGDRFPHAIGAEKTPANYKAFIYTPAANAFVLQSAARAVAAEELGRDEVPDILAINLSTNDYTGHAFGPYSPECVDLAVETDRALSVFITGLEKTVPGGMRSVVFVLTADHGVSPVPEDAGGEPYHMSAGRYDVRAVLNAISSALTARFGEPGGVAGGSWFPRNPESPKQSGAFLDGFIWLDPAAVARAIADGKARSRRDIEDAACEAVAAARVPGVYACYGRTQVLERRIADTDLSAHLARAIDPERSSDLFVVADPMYLADPDPEGHATTHGTPYAYDTHVPVIVCAPGFIKAGVYVDDAAPSDIAPTLSLLLGIEFPSGCDGRPLRSALMP